MRRTRRSDVGFRSGRYHRHSDGVAVRFGKCLPVGKPVRQATVKIADGERSAVFSDLQPGKYAAKAFHDVDGDGKMNLNPFGLPIEPVAFSNNAPANMGPPGWDRAQLMVSGNTAQTIVIR
jgi:uncharacterized protein (DUF2141 family)